MPPKEPIQIPAGLSRQQIDALVAANPKAWFILPLGEGEQLVTKAKGERWADALSWIKPLALAGLGLVIPGAWGALGAAIPTLAKGGFDHLEARLKGEPGKVWSIEEMVAERDNLPERRT